MELLGIKWAPLRVPTERRLQTAMAMFWICSLAFGGFICSFLFIYLLLFSQLRIFALIYLAWMYYDREVSENGGRRSSWVRGLVCWDYFINFFPLKLKRTVELTKEKNYLFCVFPHGLLSAGAFGHFGTERSDFNQLFPGLKVHNATLDMHFKTPFFREYLLSLGAVSASRASLMNVLGSQQKGNVMVLVVGGAAESLHAHPGTYRLVLKDRKGFIRVALKTGTSLVPVFSFGETDLYDQVANPPGSLVLKMQNALRKYTGLAPCLFIGRGILQYSFGPIPRRCPVTTVVGEPIDVPKVAAPSPEQVDEYHKKFMDALVTLFEKEKHKYIQEPDKTDLIIT